MDALTSLVILSPLKFTTSPRVERGMPIFLTARTPLCARQSNRRADTDLLPFPITLTKAPFIVSMISNNHSYHRTLTAARFPVQLPANDCTILEKSSEPEPFKQGAQHVSLNLRSLLHQTRLFCCDYSFPHIGTTQQLAHFAAKLVTIHSKTHTHIVDEENMSHHNRKADSPAT